MAFVITNLHDAAAAVAGRRRHHTDPDTPLEYSFLRPPCTTT